MPKNFLDVKAQNNTAEIRMYGYIGEWDEIQYMSFQNEFRTLVEQYTEITLRVNSGGGSVYEGFAIYDLLRNSKANITVIVEGIAASMASIISLAGDTIKMTENARFMFHRVKGGCYGNAEKMVAFSNDMIELEGQIKEVYEERTSASKEEIESWFDGLDHWKDAKKCLELGVVQEIIKPTKQKANNTIAPQNMSEKDVWQFYNTAITDPDPEPVITNQSIKPMNKHVFIAAFALAGMQNKLTAESSDEEFATQVNKMAQMAAQASGYKAQLDALTNTKVAARLAQARIDGQITTENESHFEAGLKSNYDVFDNILNQMPKQTAPLNKVEPIIPPNPSAVTAPQGREEWTIDDWRKKDAKGFAALEMTNKALFDQLLNTLITQ